MKERYFLIQFTNKNTHFIREDKWLRFDTDTKYNNKNIVSLELKFHLTYTLFIDRASKLSHNNACYIKRHLLNYDSYSEDFNITIISTNKYFMYI